MAVDLLRQLAQSGGFVDRLADHGVLEAVLGPDVARHHLTRRDADTCLALGHFDPQPLRHRTCGCKGLAIGVVQGHGSAEHGERRVTLELVQQSVMSVDLVDDHLEEPVQQGRRPRSRAGWSPSRWIR